MSLVQSLEAILNIDSGAEEFAWYADILLKSGEVEKAHQVLDKGLESNPQLLSGLLVKAKCLDADAKFDEARQLYAKILEIDDRCLSARRYLYASAVQIGQSESAAKISQRILLQDPWYPVSAVELPKAQPVAAAALAFAAPPLVDDLFGADVIPDDVFDQSESESFIEKPAEEADMGPLELGQDLPSSAEVSNAFESLFGDVDEEAESAVETAIVPDATPDLAAELSVPSQPEALADAPVADAPYLDLAPEDVGQAFDDLFGDEGLGSLPEVAASESAPAQTEPSVDFASETSSDVVEISIVDAHADLLDFPEPEPESDPLSSIFGDFEPAPVETQSTAEPVALSQEETEESPWDLGGLDPLPTDSDVNTAEIASDDSAFGFGSADLESSLDNLFGNDEDAAPIVEPEAVSEPEEEFVIQPDVAFETTDSESIDDSQVNFGERSPLEELIEAQEEETALAEQETEIFGVSESEEPLPFWEGEIENELGLESQTDSNIDDIFAESTELTPEAVGDSSPFELVEDQDPVEEEAQTSSQASGQTITLAEIYCSQGLYKQALSIYQGVLAQKDDESLRSRYAEIEELLRQKESGENQA